VIQTDLGSLIWIRITPKERSLKVLQRGEVSKETGAFESLYDGQFTLSTQLIKPNFLIFILEKTVTPGFMSKSLPLTALRKRKIV